MRVALVSIRFDRKGGSERRAYQLTRGLVEAGHDVEVFAASVEDLDLDIKVNIVPMSGGPSFMKVASFTRNVRAMLAGRPDIDITHNQIRPFTDGVVTVGGGCHAEYLREYGGAFRSLNPLHRVVLRLEREMYRPGGCRAVITNSEFSKAGILRHYPMPPERVFVAYNGVDLDKFNPNNAAVNKIKTRSRLGLTDEPVALFLGNGFGRKGLDTVIRALAIVKGMEREIRDLRLLIVGKDSPAPYKRLAVKLGVADRLLFVGGVSDPETYCAAADIFVLPTRFDPFSNATLEAMACGMPVITTSKNGVSEVIADGESGFVMRDPDDAMGLAATLAYLSCEKERKAIGARARIAAESLTWDKTLKRTLEVYEYAR